MEKSSSILQAAISLLIGLIAHNCVMLGALFAQVPPNPPGRIVVILYYVRFFEVLISNRNLKYFELQFFNV